jgi:hypothetical protein
MREHVVGTSEGRGRRDTLDSSQHRDGGDEEALHLGVSTQVDRRSNGLLARFFYLVSIRISTNARVSDGPVPYEHSY